MNTVELAIHEAITDEFVAADVVLLDIWRVTPKISDGAGGKLNGPDMLVASERPCRMLPQSRNSSEVTTQTAAGTMDNPRYVILTLSDFRFVLGDHFIWNGYRWEVSSVHDMPRYESKADVIRKERLDG